MFSRILKSFGFISTLAASVMVLTSCEGTVVIAPGAHCELVPVQVCHRYRDYWGHWHRECDTQYRRHCWNIAGAQVGAVTLASQYGIGFDAAEQLIQTSDDANHGKLDSATKLGLGTEDFAALAQFEIPTEKGITAVASN